MDIEELAMCVLDRLETTRPGSSGHDMWTRPGFINHHVGEAYTAARRQLQPGGALVFDSTSAIDAFPDYAQALSEAWSFLESQSYLVPDVRKRGRVVVGRRGKERHAKLVAESATASEPAGSPVPASGPSDPESVKARPSTVETPPEDEPVTVAVLWAHGDPAWTKDEQEAWEKTVLAFTHLLYANGIEADLDLFHGHLPVDWSRFGPTAISGSDFVLIAVSPTWRRAWEGKNDPGKNAGAVGEANTLRGLFSKNQEAFRERVFPVILPGRSEDDLPAELRASARWSKVPVLTDDGIEDLLRLLTREPAYPRPPLGRRRKLPPRVQNLDAFQDEALPHRYVPSAEGAGSADLEAQLRRAEEAASEMPAQSPGAETEPWDQAREAVDARTGDLRERVRRLTDLERRRQSRLSSPPRLVPHQGWPTGTFNMHLPNGPLNVHLVNSGGSAAKVVGATLDTPLGKFEGVMWAEEPAPLQPEHGSGASLPRDGDLTIQFGDGSLEGLQGMDQALALRVEFRPEGDTTTYELRCSLHRANSDARSRPLWRAKNVETQVVG